MAGKLQAGVIRLGSMGWSPDAARVCKNFAMSQSPPSFSPIRRGVQESQVSSPSSAEEDAGNNQVARRILDDPVEAEPASTYIDQEADQEEEEEEEEASADEAAERGRSPARGGWQTVGSATAGLVPGVQVMRSSFVGAQESDGEDEDEEEECQHDDTRESSLNGAYAAQGSFSSTAQSPVAVGAGTAHHAEPALQQPGVVYREADDEEDDEEEDQEEVMERQEAANKHIEQQQEQEEEGEDEEEDEEEEEEEAGVQANKKQKLVHEHVAEQSAMDLTPCETRDNGEQQDEDGQEDEEEQEEEEEDEEEGDGENGGQNKNAGTNENATQMDTETYAHTQIDAQMVEAEGCTALVPADANETADQQIVAAPNTDSWGYLPPEANSEWAVREDVCSLQVGGASLRLPRAVHDRLYTYQRQGVAWMWNLYHKGFGGILADEMGLGKTVQAAAFLACLKFTEEGSRFLLIVPATLLEQWRRELDTWAHETGLAVHMYHGSMQERQKALRGLLAKGGVLLTTYDIVRISISHLRSPTSAMANAGLSRKRKRQDKRACRDDDDPSEEEEEPVNPEVVQQVMDTNAPWDVVIVDEAHQIKNPSCQHGRVLRRLESRSRILLSGTPLQNKLSDLWALMDFAQPALLGNHATFERTFSEQIAKGSTKNASRFAVELKDHLARELKRLTAPHFLRRMKAEVTLPPSMPQASSSCPQELPSKVDVILWLSITQAQQELYNLFLESNLVRKATSQSKCGLEALRAIALLKKLCNHPLLCLPKEEFADWRMNVVAGEQLAQAGMPVQDPRNSVASARGAEDAGDTQPAPECQEVLPRLRALLPSSVQGATLLSCKLRVLSVLLPQLHKRGHRCLIFSQSTRMLDLIQACVLRVLELKFLRVDGTVDVKDRDLKINKFQQPDSRYFAMCLSTHVGGVGLTLTSADRVVLVDPAWNPAMDAQAIDRVHRIGQSKDVVVYRLIGAGAIEDKMFRLQVFKKGLAKTAFEQEHQIRFFSKKDLKLLFEAPNQSASTQSLMAEQLGTEALEHEDLLRVVASDIGSTDDPQALPFWQSSDVLGFSDYQRLFMYLERANQAEAEAVEQAKALTARLKSEEYVKDQVVDGKVRSWHRDSQSKENVSPQDAEEPLPIEDEGNPETR